MGTDQLGAPPTVRERSAREEGSESAVHSAKKKKRVK